jgi:hypothetical protein
MTQDYWDGVLIGSLGSGFIWRWIFFVADDIRAWWRKDGRNQWKEEGK